MQLQAVGSSVFKPRDFEGQAVDAAWSPRAARSLGVAVARHGRGPPTRPRCLLCILRVSRYCDNIRELNPAGTVGLNALLSVPWPRDPQLCALLPSPST